MAPPIDVPLRPGPVHQGARRGGHPSRQLITTGVGVLKDAAGAGSGQWLGLLAIRERRPRRRA